MAAIIDGKTLAVKRQIELVEKVEKLRAETGAVPGLVAILVGDDPASQVYVRNKERSAKKAGFLNETVRLSESISEEELIQVTEQYNEDDRFHGTLVQLPLPVHINDKRVILAIDPKKDVDGFHLINTGHLWNGRPVMVPYTPAGIMELLREYDIDLEGKTAVIIGRSNIVGKSIAQLLLDKNAMVILAHSCTRHLARVTKQADILIVAIGQGHFVTKEFVKEGAVVTDVGMNRDDNDKLIEDVKFGKVEPLASLITPVPGGVDPVTITMLMEQTYQSALRGVKV